MNEHRVPRRTMRRPVAVVLGLGLSAGFLALLFRRVDLGPVLEHATHTSLSVLLLTLVFKTGGLCCLGWRTRILLRPVSGITVRSTAASHILSAAVNSALPFRVGELFRIHYLAVRGQVPHATSLATVGLERLLDLFCLLVLFAGALPLAGSRAPELPTVLVVGGAILVGCLALAVIQSKHDVLVPLLARLARLGGDRIARRVAEKAERFASGLKALESLHVMLAIALLSFANWTLAALSIQAWFWATGLTLPACAPFIVLGFVAFGTALPTSPGSVGNYHYFVVLALTSVFSVDPTVATSVALVGHAAAFVPVTLVGLVLLWFQRSLLRDGLARRSAAPRAEGETRCST